METIYKHIPVQSLHTYTLSEPDEYFAHCVHLRELGEFVPLRSFNRFATMISHFNTFLRKRLEKHQRRYAGRRFTTFIYFVYDSPNGSPTKKQQERYIQQCGENGVNDHLDRVFGCVISPHLFISESGDTIMLNITVEWHKTPKK
jgi:hypothetical protein